MDKKSSIQENKRTKNMKKKKQKQANESAYRNNGNKIKKKTVYILEDSVVKRLNGFLLTNKN